MTKKRLHRSLLYTILWLAPLVCTGQGPECFFVHFDKSFYVSGETIWFKIYQLDTTNQALSRVIYIELTSADNQLVVTKKLLVKNGESNGNIVLPLSVSEGYYRFQAYTRYNLNFDPPAVYQASIPVYSLDSKIPEVSKLKPQTYLPNGGTGISVSTDQKTYQPRDSLTVSFRMDQPINNTDQNFSISVVPSALSIPDYSFYQDLKCPDLIPGQGKRYLPEKALYLEGKIQHPITGSEVSSRLLSVYFDQTQQLLRASSRNGAIRVAVPDYWGTGTFQILNLDPFNPEVLKIVPVNIQLPDNEYTNSNLPRRSDKVLNYLSKLKKRRKVIELFDLYNVPQSAPKAPLPKIPDASYLTSNFKQIYTLEQFINEAIQNVKVRELDSAKTVRLFNREQGRLFEDHPWYLVDEFLTFNESEVLQIPYQDIVEVRLYYKAATLEKYFSGFMKRGGVMEIITRDVKYVRKLRNNPNIVEIEGYSDPESFTESLTTSKNNRLPDLRGTIFWSPKVPINDSAAGQVTIPLSDDTGDFTIVIMGVNHMNQPVVGYSTYSVKMKNNNE